MNSTKSAEKSREELLGIIAALDRARALAEFTLDGTILHANQNFLDLFGYRANDLTGRHHRVLVNQSDGESADYAGFWRRLKGGDFVSDRFRQVDKQGREIWLQATFDPILDTAGLPYKIVMSATDVTNSVRRSADRAAELQANEAYNLAAPKPGTEGVTEQDAAAGGRPDCLWRVLEETHCAILIVERGGEIAYANPGFVRSSGFSREDVIGAVVGDLVFGRRTDAALVAKIKRCLASGECFSDELLTYDRERKPSWSSLVINPVRGPDGHVDRSVWMQADVTATKQRALDLAAKIEAIGASNAMAEWTVSGVPIAANPLVARGEPFDIPLGRLLDDDAIAEVLRVGRLRRDVALSRTQAEPMWLDAVFSLLTDPQDQPSRILMCGAEIQARRAATTRSIEGMSLMVERIAGIVEVITTLARQTNLLALNAAVEAVRAKENGRGFAVVAHEIRKLSLEAAAATSKITGALVDGRVLIRSMSESDGVDKDSMTQRRAIAFSRALRGRGRG